MVNTEKEKNSDHSIKEPLVISKHFHLPRVFMILIVVIIAAIFSGIYSYLLGASQQMVNEQSSQNISPTISNIKLSPTISQSRDTISNSPTEVMTDVDWSHWRMYKNEKYNFVISYPDDTSYADPLNGTYGKKYFLTEQSNGFTITESNVENGKITNAITKTVTIYDATPYDKDHLEAWWEKNITDEVDHKPVPQGYDVQVNFLPFANCIQAYHPNWKVPPTLDVQEKATVPGNYPDSYYSYYDFGRPFILHFSEYEGGACGAAGETYLYTTMAKLN